MIGLTCTVHFSFQDSKMIAISDVRLMRLCLIYGSVLFPVCDRPLFDGFSVLFWICAPSG